MPTTLDGEVKLNKGYLTEGDRADLRTDQQNSTKNEHKIISNLHTIQMLVSIVQKP